MTTRRQKTVQDHVDAARRFLDQSDLEFAAGDNRQGSEKLWGAVTQAVMAVAKQRGWDWGKHGARRAAVSRLDSEDPSYTLPWDYSRLNSSTPTFTMTSWKTTKLPRAAR